MLRVFHSDSTVGHPALGPEADFVASMAAERFSQSISVVLPAFNEEECIEKAVRDAAAYLPRRFDDWEIVVVDDGSTDATAAIVRDLAAEEPRIKLLRHARNAGYGRAIATGFEAARGDLVFYTDSDNQFDIREIGDLVPLAGEADAVYGYRVQRDDPALRCLLSWVYNRLVRVLFRVQIRDVDCAFKLFTRQVVDSLRLESSDFFIDTEMVARTARLGFRTAEKGVRHYPRSAGHSTVRPSDIPRTLRTVARMWFCIHFPRRFTPALTTVGLVDPR